MSKIERREFIKLGGLASAAVMLFPGCAIKEEDSSYHFFNNEEADTLIAFTEQLIPADKTYGGATDACVIYYIDRQLKGPFKKYASNYRNDIKKLNDYCQLKYNCSFAKLSSAKQIDFMKLMEKNKLDEKIWRLPSVFFKTVHTHTKQGFYGSPVHGGNKDHMSFAMMNIDGLLQIRLEDPAKSQDPTFNQ